MSPGSKAKNRCALVVTGIEDRYQSPHPSRPLGYVAESWARHPSGPFGVMSKVAGRSEPGLSQSVLRPKTASMEGRLDHLDGNVQPSLRW